ncbi:LysR substrate-binding domain-containing protein [Rhizobium halophytocola]|uniref:DNA-binding transcriptional LysR family regulator n=1 Tax=Rhizobium halophytocola TaxID=735519 RepID=A0ABS4DSI5_9HYPH|nr:LysR substrate-binding domain-containing protein [Rhizobium halophytocola]MBP1848632.1 DNA-binding transcriptional LysR family regulator [Rhizobium halophytocola]
MELRHLRYFRIAAEQLHFNRAATILRIAQPALSIQIKALEAELGVALFDRVGRGVVLTEPGKLFLEEAVAILDRVDRATEKVRAVASGVEGRVRVGFTETASFSPLVTQVLAQFRSAWPQVQLVLEQAHTEALLRAMSDDVIDVAFVRPPVRAEFPHGYLTLADEAMVVAVHVAHPLADRAQLRLADLRQEKFIVYPRRHGAGLSDSVLAECRSAGFVPEIIQQTPQLSATINLVASGIGVAIVPGCMREVRNREVRFLGLEDLKVKAELAVLWRSGPGQTAVDNFVATAAAIRQDRPA